MKHKVLICYGFMSDHRMVYDKRLVAVYIHNSSMPDLYHWAQLFCADTWEEIIMLADKNKEISECIVTLKELSEDERIQLECEAREKARRDAVAREDYVFDKGVEHGMEQGLDRMAQLNVILIKDKRFADLEKASTDPAYRDCLFVEYNL